VPRILGLNFFMSFYTFLGSLMLTALAYLMTGSSSFCKWFDWAFCSSSELETALRELLLLPLLLLLTL
jgi:hypothetical protein